MLFVTLNFLARLIEKYSSDDSFNGSSVLRVMEKLKAMNLNLSELQDSRAATVISGIRKHSNADIANAAKQLRTFWKESMIESVSHSHPQPSNANEVASSPAGIEVTVDKANA